MVDFLEYQDNIRGLSEDIALTISDFVTNSRNDLQRANIVPLLFLIFLGKLYLYTLHFSFYLLILLKRALFQSASS